MAAFLGASRAIARHAARRHQRSRSRTGIPLLGVGGGQWQHSAGKWGESQLVGRAPLRVRHAPTSCPESDHEMQQLCILRGISSGGLCSWPCVPERLQMDRSQQGRGSGVMSPLLGCKCPLRCGGRAPEQDIPTHSGGQQDAFRRPGYIGGRWRPSRTASLVLLAAFALRAWVRPPAVLVGLCPGPRTNVSGGHLPPSSPRGESVIALPGLGKWST